MALENFLTAPVQELVYQLFLPFLILFVILWGVLSSLNVFGKKINLVLALGLCTIIVPTEAFAIFARYLTALSGYAAVGAFAVLFIFGITVWSIGKGRDIYHGALEPTRKERRINEKLEKSRKKLADERDQKKKKALIEEIKNLKDDLEVAQAERRYR